MPHVLEYFAEDTSIKHIQWQIVWKLQNYTFLITCIDQVKS